MQPEPGLLEYLLAGKYLPAIGVALIAFVTFARASLSGWWPWFSTRAGGYVLGFGTAFVLYVGEAFRNDVKPTAGLMAGALAAGWAAAGGFEMLRDLLDYLRRKPKAAPTVITLVLAVALVGCSSGCKSGPDGKPWDHATNAVIDCTRQDQGQITSLIAELLPLAYLERPNWQSIGDKAVAAGVSIGGCALAELVDLYLGNRKITQSDEATWCAYQTLEDFRARVAGGATFRTARGDL